MILKCSLILTDNALNGFKSLTTHNLWNLSSENVQLKIMAALKTIMPF